MIRSLTRNELKCIARQEHDYKVVSASNIGVGYCCRNCKHTEYVSLSSPLAWKDWQPPEKKDFTRDIPYDRVY